VQWKCAGSEKRRTENGRTENGERRQENGDRRQETGDRKKGKWKDGKRENGERRTENGDRRTGRRRMEIEKVGNLVFVFFRKEVYFVFDALAYEVW
jgi:hypothetical protein